jgi:hypothetical protein
MPSENVELTRRIYRRWEEGDFSSVEWAHPEIEFVPADSCSRSGTAGWSDWRCSRTPPRRAGPRTSVADILA